MTRLHLALPHAPQAAGDARREVGDRVRSAWPHLTGLDELVDDVRLVTSEIVANAIRHGEPPLDLDLELVRLDGLHRVVLTCRDGGPWDGTEPSPSGGRGLIIVHALCTRVDIVADERQTTVTATLER